LERQNFQTTVERQQRDIEDLRQQVRVLIPLVSEIFILIYCSLHPLFRIRIWIHRIHMILGLPDPDPLVRGMDPDPDPALDPDSGSGRIQKFFNWSYKSDPSRDLIFLTILYNRHLMNWSNLF
jgi:hypothetical protein